MCAKVVLRQINEHTLQHPQDWAAAHPQGEEETGAARIEALTQYKAVHLLSVQARGAFIFHYTYGLEYKLDGSPQGCALTPWYLMLDTRLLNA